MAWFGRRAGKKNSARAGGEEAAGAEVPPEIEAVVHADKGVAPVAAPEGPLDVSQVPDLGERIDFGALRVPAVTGVTPILEYDPQTEKAYSVRLDAGHSSAVLVLYAAPRTRGIWEEVRNEMGLSISSDGGTCTDVKGPRGIELHASLPATGHDGKKTLLPARIIGIDGPRWFLRVMVLGRAAIAPEEAGFLEEILSATVVVRGPQAMAPKDIIELRMPSAPAPEAEPERTELTDLDHGPTITEIR